MKFENAKNLTECLQHVVVSLGLITAGIWAYYTFDVLNQRERAQVELEGIRHRIEEQKALSDSTRKLQEFELEKFSQETAAKASLSASLFIEQLSSGEETYLKIRVSIKNSGKDRAKLRLGSRVLAVSQVTFNEDRTMRLTKVQHLGPTFFFDTTKVMQSTIPHVYLDGKSSLDLTFLAAIADPGLYFVTFSSSQFGKAIEVLKAEIGSQPWEQLNLHISDYVVIK